MTAPGTLAEAYGYCRMVARTEAKNFYWSFRVLPKAKSDAMCAVYAFMRRADDIADDESKPVAERRLEMKEWVDSYHGRADAAVSDKRIFQALRDTKRRFGIGDDLLEDLVRGTSMDLEEGHGAGGAIKLGDGLEGYQTFEDLYRYCYLVASVVGLVCIKIFGYSDPHAELLAERTGIAFQLTNILRDVKEDVERRRVYLPQSLLGEFQVSNADVVALAGGRKMRPNDHAMISALSVQAWEYYASARELLPLINKDSRAALWVLVEIYSRLLQKIDAKHGDVFASRVSVPTGEKMLALLRGAAMSVWARL